MFRVLLTLTAYGTLYDHSPPPPRFQHDVTVTVRWESESAVDGECSANAGAPPAGKHYGGCRLPDGTLVLPNACLHALESDWRLTVCHEIGHANGWGKLHPAR